MKSIFERIGGTYTQVGDYYLPNLELPTEDDIEIGIWGQRKLRYIKEHRQTLCYDLIMRCRLNSYLADIDEQVESLLPRLVKEMAEQEGVTEQLKEENQMEWARRMNNIRNRAMEIINDELIYR